MHKLPQQFQFKGWASFGNLECALFGVEDFETPSALRFSVIMEQIPFVSDIVKQFPSMVYLLVNGDLSWLASICVLLFNVGL